MNAKTKFFVPLFLWVYPILCKAETLNEFGYIPAASGFSYYRNPSLCAFSPQPLFIVSVSNLYALKELQQSNIHIIMPYKHSGIEVSRQSLGNGIYNESQWGIGLSHSISKNLAFATKAIYKQFSIQSYGKIGHFCLNIGLIAHINKKMDLAFTGNEIVLHAKDKPYEVYSKNRFSWSVKYSISSNFKFLAEIDKTQRFKPDLRTGFFYTADSNWTMHFILSNRFSEPGIGLHFKKKQMRFSTSFLIHVALGISSNISIVYAFKK